MTKNEEADLARPARQRNRQSAWTGWYPDTQQGQGCNRRKEKATATTSGQEEMIVPDAELPEVRQWQMHCATGSQLSKMVVEGRIKVLTLTV